MNWRVFTIIPSLLISGVSPVVAQEDPPAPPPAAGQDEFSVDLLQGRLKEIGESPELDEAAKKALGDRYREALDSLAQAARFRGLEEEYRRALTQGPEETRRIQAEIEALKNTDPAKQLPNGINGQSSGEQLDAALLRQQAELSARKAELKGLEDDLAAIGKRAGQIGDRQTAAGTELVATTRELDAAGDESAEAADKTKQAERARLRARREQLEAELAMIEQESLSGEIRLATKEAARDLAEQKVALAEKSITVIRNLVSVMLADQLGGIEATVAEVRRKMPGLAPKLDEFLSQVSTLTTEARKVAGSIKSDSQLAADREAELNRIGNASDELDEQLELGGVGGSLVPILLDHLRTLPSERDSKQRLARIGSQQVEARNGLFELSRSIRGNDKDGEPGGEIPEDVAKSIDSLKESRDVLRQDLRSSYRSWIRILVGLDRTEREIQVKSEQFRRFTQEALLLARTSPVIGSQTFRSLPEGLAYCFGADRLSELGRRLSAVPLGFHLLALLLLAAMIAGRRVFVRQLRASTQRTRRISSDRYLNTVVALTMTVLIAVPAALAAFLMGVILRFQPDATQWSFALGSGLLKSSWFLLQAGFLIVLCRKEGLGEGHFRWSAGLLRRVRRFSWWLILVCVPAQITASLVMTEAGVRHLDGLGRMAGLVMALGVGGALAYLMHPEQGAAAMVHRKTPRSLFGRLSKVWFALSVAFTLCLVGLLLGGYVFAGVLLMERVVRSLASVTGALVIYGLILRWFSIRERKLAIEEALRSRRARQDAALKEQAGAEEPGSSSAEESRIPEINEEEVVDLAKVGEQTRSLIGFMVGAGLLVKLSFIWSEFGPILQFFRSSELLGVVSIGDLALAVLVISVVVATMRNLPGLLEMVILSRLELDAGTRNSIITLANYGVIAAGAAFLFQTLGVDWSHFGWIAAALSVGLGFGLQEVVANFVCGIILLFERPVRVGDIVTVDGIDGVVSRIQIRATTITNWDRKEFVVPNKQFVTGTVLNWTLSNPMNRVLISVGVAYGSDTGRALQILIDVAKNHPLILDEPLPMATFEEFADSSLTLRLRCFLPDMDNRVKTISELNTEIDKRFKEAGIEIPFPQRDLHVRSVEPEIRVGGAGGR